MTDMQPLSNRAANVLAVVLREMMAYAAGWRLDWSDFDGRTLRDQLSDLATWAEKALVEEVEEFQCGTHFLDSVEEACNAW